MRFYEDINLDETESFERVITEDMVRHFAEISGDNNPLHLDEEFAKTTQFKSRIVHGALLASLISATLFKFAGNGAIYSSQEVRFLRPVYIDDKVTVTIKVMSKEIKRRNGIVHLYAKCTNSQGKIVLDGKSEIIAARREV